MKLKKLPYTCSSKPRINYFYWYRVFLMFDIVSITEISKKNLISALGYVRIFDVFKHGNKCEISHILLEVNPFGIVMY